MSAGLETYFCLVYRYVPLFVSHIMSAASFDLKIATSQQSSREHDLSKQLGSQQVQQMVDDVKFWLSFFFFVYLTFWFSQMRNIKYLLINQIIKQTVIKIRPDQPTKTIKSCELTKSGHK